MNGYIKTRAKCPWEQSNTRMKKETINNYKSVHKKTEQTEKSAI